MDRFRNLARRKVILLEIHELEIRYREAIEKDEIFEVKKSIRLAIQSLKVELEALNEDLKASLNEDTALRRQESQQKDMINPV